MATNDRRLRWRCRRGMRELDLLLEAFVDRRYAALSATEQSAFAALLEQTDPDLYDWLLGRTAPPTPELRRGVALLQEERGRR